MFKVCHTSDKTGMTDEVKETVVSAYTFLWHHMLCVHGHTCDFELQSTYSYILARLDWYIEKMYLYACWMLFQCACWVVCACCSYMHLLDTMHLFIYACWMELIHILLDVHIYKIFQYACWMLMFIHACWMVLRMLVNCLAAHICLLPWIMASCC